LHLIIPVLLAAAPLHAAAINPGAPDAVPPEEFRIMTPHEIAEHKSKMASLSGTAREEYRNTQYRMLKERALAQGYLLPDTPPWGRTEVVPGVSAPQPAAPAPAEDQRQAEDAAIMQQLIEEQKTVVQEALSGGEPQAAPQPAAAEESIPTAPIAGSPQPAEAPAAAVDSTLGKAPPATTPEPPATPAAPAPVAAAPAEPSAKATPGLAAQAEAPQAPVATGDSEPASPASKAVQKEYRDQMRQRFDSFMAQREAREQEREAQRQRYAEEMQRRREAYRQQQPQAQPYYQPAPAMPWPPYPPAAGYGRPPQLQPQPYAPY
jgi:hypothetical protein